ncbi:hypothetical protein L6250_02970 [Candidatus Parcubacteria bacterium]|nr:hypothetical protein [Candidatus Parcubacteria bacterium]
MKIVVPEKLREPLGGLIVVSLGIDGCVWVQSKKNWEKLKDVMLNRHFDKESSGVKLLIKAYIASARNTIMNQSGEIKILKEFADYARLKNKVVFTVAGGKIEVWAEEVFRKWDKRVKRFELSRRGFAGRGRII